MSNGNIVMINDIEVLVIPPTEEDNFIRFDVQGDDHKYEMLHRWGLISKTAQQKRELKDILYYPSGSKVAILSEVVGYIPWDDFDGGQETVVLRLEEYYTKIHPVYLKEMQGKAFGNAETGVEKKKVQKKVQKKVVARDSTGIPNDYVIYDIETTGIKQDDEIIEIAAFKVSGIEIVDRFESLIALPEHITRGRDIASHIHGMTFDVLEGAPSAEQVLTEFLDFVGDLTVVGHNIISFDNVVISRMLNKYLGKKFNNKSIDTVVLSRRYFNHLSSHKLGDVANFFDIPYVGAHRSSADCEITYNVFLSIREYMRENGLKLNEKKEESSKVQSPRKRSNFDRFKVESVTTDKEIFDESHFLFGMNCALSDVTSKEEIAQFIKDAGGEPQSNVTRSTNVLICGDGATTGKVKKANEYNDKYSQGIVIISESEFYKKIEG